MRDTKKADYARRAKVKKYKDGPVKLRFLSHSQFSIGDIIFSNPTIFIGQNGSGKSRILRLIFNLLSNNHTYDYDSRDRFDLSAEISLNGVVSESTAYRYHQGSVKFIGNKYTSLSYINPSESSSIDVDWLRNQSDLYELLDQYTPYVFINKELDLINLISGKSYTAIEAFVLYDIEPEHKYFIVDDGKKKYDSLTMGSGELSLITLFFHIKTSPKGSLIILDEPESSLVYYSQSNLLVLMHAYMIKNDNYFIISTHSNAIISESDRKNVVLLYHSDNKIKYQISPPESIISSTIGVNFQYKLNIYVEDTFAKKLIEKILQINLQDYYSRINIIMLNSESNLEFLVKSGALDRSQNLLVIFDGDSKSRIDYKNESVLFIPGERAPEIVVIDYLINHKAELSKRINKTIIELDIAINSTITINHHDRLREISNYLSIELNFLEDHACQLFSEGIRPDILNGIIEPICRKMKGFT